MNFEEFDFKRAAKSEKAMNMFGCFRLSARIADLRKGGMKIVTKYVTQNGKTFAQYRLG